MTWNKMNILNVFQKSLFKETFYRVEYLRMKITVNLEEAHVSLLAVTVFSELQ